MDDGRRPTLVAVCGIPFAGKSTLARQIVARTGAVLVSVDMIVKDMDIDLGQHAENQHGWARAMAAGFERARRHLADGESVVYDNANHTRRNRDRCRRVAETARAGFRGIWVDVPVEVARARLLANRADPERSDVPDVAFWQIVDQFEPPTDEPDVVQWQPGVRIDTLMDTLRLMANTPCHSEP